MLKVVKVALTGALVFVICTLAADAVWAVQEQSEFWSPHVLFQGDGGSVAIALYGDTGGCGCGPTGVDQVYIASVAIQFDWQQLSNNSFSAAVNGNLVTGSTATYVITFVIPANVTVGPHSYTASYKGRMGDAHVLASGSLYVHDAREKLYDAEIPSVRRSLAAALNATIQSPAAKSQLASARSAFAQATVSAQLGNYGDAVSQLNETSAYLRQVQSSELNYQALSKQQADSTWKFEMLGAVGLVAAVAAGSLWFGRSRGRRRTTGG